MQKVLAMQVAAQLTAAACGQANNLPLSPDLADNQVRARNLQVWETFRVFYRGVVAALDDDQSWPAPRQDAGSLLPGIAQSLAPLLGTGPLGDIVKRLISLLPLPAIASAEKLPDPGIKPAA